MPSASHLKELHRLINNTPSPAHANATIRLQGFIDAVSSVEIRHLHAAVTNILAGRAPGIDAAYAIYPPMLALECRRQLDIELRGLELDRKFGVNRVIDPKLQPYLLPGPKKTAESMARVRELAQGYRPPADPLVPAGASRDIMADTQARFPADMDPAAVKKRLKI